VSGSRLRVLRLDLPLDAGFDARLKEDPLFDLSVLPVHAGIDAAADLLASAHAYHVSSARNELPAPWWVGGDLLARAPQLLCVSTYGAGYDTVDLEACTRAGVCVFNQAGSNAGAVAEHVFGLVLALRRHIRNCDQAMRREPPVRRHAFTGRDLEGDTLGLVGIGHIGTRVAALGRAFGMRVIASDPGLSEADIAARGAEPVDLSSLLAAAGVVSVHCPLQADTAGMFGHAQFAAMRPGALFISTARGGIHDETALHAALASGYLGGAGLDVWSVEPPRPDHPLLDLPNVVATCHIAGVTTGARAAMAGMAARQLGDFARGRRPHNLLNPQAWPACAERLARLHGGRPPA